MGRARRARRIAATAAYGGGVGAAGIGALGLIGFAVLKLEAQLARRVVGQPFDGAPDDNGVYGAGLGEPVDLLVLGDSSAAGMGAESSHQTVGAIIATGVSALLGRPVRLTNVAVVGAESSGLDVQLARAFAEVPHPLRLLARRRSRDLAAAQTVAVVEAGGRTVSLGDLLGPEFAERPHELFSADRCHPSPAGYARAGAALLPSVCAALGLWAGADDHRGPDVRRGEGISPVAVAAVQAVRDPGTEVSATAVGGQPRGPRGRWATLRHRPRKPVTDRSELAGGPDGGPGALEGAGPVPDGL